MAHALLRELEWRGLVQEVTPGLATRLTRGPITGYVGFDPTARSLQIGNLVVVQLLVHLQRHGHRPIALVGGGTALIGDPSGKRGERPLLSRTEVEERAELQRVQLERFLDFSGPRAARVVNNIDWLDGVSILDFLRDAGKHFTVNYMMQKESVRSRLDAGISYTEFSYMVVQAFDFAHLFRTHECELQLGGSDQWGNITAGAELIRRTVGEEAHGLAAPLVTTSTGAKFGKTEEGAVWLDPAMTSPYKFHQFWLNVEDAGIEQYLKIFSLAPRDDLESLLQQNTDQPEARTAQHALARELTERVHGRDTLQRVERAAAILFGGFDPRAAEDDVFEVLAGELPLATVDAEATIVDVLVTSGLASSKGDARRTVGQGGVYLNQQRVEADRPLQPSDWLARGYALLRKGTKRHALVRAHRAVG